MEKFRIIEPTPVLAPFVRHYWLLVSDDEVQSQRIIPSGYTELIFHRGNRMLRDGSLSARTSVCGQSMSFSDLAPTGEVDMIVVVFQPFGARAFFHMAIYELSGLCVSPDEMGDNSLKELEDRILETPDDEACIALIEQFLTRRLSPLKEYNYKRMVAAVRAINLSGGEMSVSELAQIACLISHFMRGSNITPEIIDTMLQMKNTTVRMMGEHNFLKFYEGFSLAMGALIIFYGLQALMNDRPNRKVIIMNIVASALSGVISVIYFHPMAYSFFAFSLICFTVSLIKYKRERA